MSDLYTGINDALRARGWGTWGDPPNNRDQLGVEHAKPVSDPVNHPDHYQAGGLEAIDMIDAFVNDPVSFYLGNVIKYVTRAGHKGDTATDLEKAAWYLNRAINHTKENK